MMDEKTKRSAWLSFLEHLVFQYIQCLLQSCNKIPTKKAAAAIQKVRDDKEVIEGRFQQYMSARACQSGIEVLDDIVTFFECTPDFISLPCEKLRKTQGKQFNFKIVSNLMSLRQDWTRQEQQEALKICKDIIDNFKDELIADTNQNPKAKQGLF